MDGRKSYSKTVRSVICILLVMLLIQGCSEKRIPPVSELCMDSEGKTGAGISAGSTYDEWVSAYGDYEIQIADGENFVPYTVDRPEDRKEGDETVSHDGRYMVAAFYIDEVPTSVEDLARTEGVTADELADHLTSPDYLAKHSVIFRYMIFIIENDTVSNIACDYLDYNTEL